MMSAPTRLLRDRRLVVGSVAVAPRRRAPRRGRPLGRLRSPGSRAGRGPGGLAVRRRAGGGRQRERRAPRLRAGLRQDRQRRREPRRRQGGGTRSPGGRSQCCVADPEAQCRAARPPQHDVPHRRGVEQGQGPALAVRGDRRRARHAPARCRGLRGLPRPSGAAGRVRAGRCRRPPGARPGGGRGPAPPARRRRPGLRPRPGRPVPWPTRYSATRPRCGATTACSLRS